MSETLLAKIDEYRRVMMEADVFVTPGEMDEAYNEMAAAIQGELAGLFPLVLVVMTGGLISAGKLLPRFNMPLELDYLQISRYGARTRGGPLEWRAYPSQPMLGRHVLVIDDILDEGHTLRGIEQWLTGQGAASVWTAVAVQKDNPDRDPSQRAHFVGVFAPNRFLFGEGMDYKGMFRNLNGIYALPEV